MVLATVAPPPLVPMVGCEYALPVRQNKAYRLPFPDAMQMSLTGMKVVKNTVPPRRVGLLRARSPPVGYVTNQPCLLATTPASEVVPVPLNVLTPARPVT